MGHVKKLEEKCKELLEQEVEDKIIEVLILYPGISVSMLHYVIGKKAQEWRPIFEKLLQKGVVQKVVVKNSGADRMSSKYFYAHDECLDFYMSALKGHAQGGQLEIIA